MQIKIFYTKWRLFLFRQKECEMLICFLSQASFHLLINISFYMSDMQKEDSKDVTISSNNVQKVLSDQRNSHKDCLWVQRCWFVICSFSANTLILSHFWFGNPSPFFFFGDIKARNLWGPTRFGFGTLCLIYW